MKSNWSLLPIRRDLKSSSDASSSKSLWTCEDRLASFRETLDCLHFGPFGARGGFFTPDLMVVFFILSGCACRLVCWRVCTIQVLCVMPKPTIWRSLRNKDGYAESRQKPFNCERYCLSINWVGGLNNLRRGQDPAHKNQRRTTFMIPATNRKPSEVQRSSRRYYSAPGSNKIDSTKILNVLADSNSPRLWRNQQMQRGERQAGCWRE